MYVKLSSYPDPPKVYRLDFPKLTGGLNLWELDYRLDADQSPNMKNLWWQDGVLQCRDGQVYLSSGTTLGVGYTCYNVLFFGRAFFHIGAKLYYADPEADNFALTELTAGVPEKRGTFFRYLDWLYYKNEGGFFQIAYDPDSETPFTAAKMTDKAYVPVTVMNADPDTGAGSTYQPENRLSPDKTMWYNAKANAKVYHLPLKPVDSVVKVVVDGVEKTPETDYTVDAEAGTVTFTTAPPVTDPATNNTVKITYRKANPDALAAVMNCKYATAAGGDRSLCILLAGCPAQPNAVFWNANDSLSMNQGYFPVTNYNLVGATMDPVTGFGKQYSDIIVLKEHSVGKLEYSIQEVDGRNSISFTYANINDKVGCDLPWTIQLIENNLVFCNTYQGVHVLRSSSAAYENNVECISRNVNGSVSVGLDEYHMKGLLYDLQHAQDPGQITSHDDDNRYWLCVGGAVYLWDYVLSSFSDPSWFYLTDIPAVALFGDDAHRTHHLDAQGRVTRFGRYFSDYGAGIEKVYQFPVSYFGDYSRLKDIVSVIISTRSDTETVIGIRYDTDYETRDDKTEIVTWSWTWMNLDLTANILGYYNLSAPRYAKVAKRRPGCRHIRHFTMTLSNNIPGEDLAIVSAQVYYKFQGKER